jgi:tRNA 2-selenouridine synthase
MWQRGQCIQIKIAKEQRIALLKEEYRHFLENSDTLDEKLNHLTGLHGKSVIQKWQALSARRAWDELVAELLEKHYDPAYNKSTSKHYVNFAAALVIHPADISAKDFLAAAHIAMHDQTR